MKLLPRHAGPSSDRRLPSPVPPPSRARRPFVAGSVATALASALLVAAPAAAQVRQPSALMEQMPQPVNLNAEGSIANARGFQLVNGFNVVTLEALFAANNETLNPVMNAQTKPGTFSPMCDFTGQLVLRGGGCHVGFGWYNVVDGATTPPPANQIYELVPADLPRCAMGPVLDPAVACCDDTEFCPLAAPNSTQVGQHDWTAPVFRATNIRADPRYRGGLVGFAMIGRAGERCTQTKFSQAELNVKNAQGVPWVSTLIYQSTVDPNAYYIAFEDLPVSQGSWRGDGNGNDGDFNDFVYRVTGLTCNGGGQACQTMMPGICRDGTTQCSNGDQVTCTPNIQPMPEACDGLDNNCNGMIDDGDDLCGSADQICDKGKCIRRCSESEFPCLGGLACDQGYCKDPACIGVNCAEGQVCQAGVCRGTCTDEVHCPPQQVCRIGRCVDPCAGISCMADLVCEGGACVPQCGPCRRCSAGQVCGPEKRCIDAGCDQQTCNPPQSVCVAGACKDGCEGVTCPGGQTCAAGACNEVALPGDGSGGRVGTTIDAGPGTGGRIGTILDAGARDSGGGTGSTGGGAASGGGVRTCGCEAGPPGGGELLACLALMAAVGLRPRRRPRRG